MTWSGVAPGLCARLPYQEGFGSGKLPSWARWRYPCNMCCVLSALTRVLLVRMLQPKLLQGWHTSTAPLRDDAEPWLLCALLRCARMVWGTWQLFLLQAGLLSWESLLQVWSTFDVLDHVAGIGTVTALGQCLAERCPGCGGCAGGLFAVCHCPDTCPALSHTCWFDGIGEHNSSQMCLVNSSGGSVGQSFTLLTFIWSEVPWLLWVKVEAMVCVGEDWSLRKAGSSGGTMSPVHSLSQT